MTTKIEWTDVTDNIIVAEGGGWWCRKSSPACDNCYAEKLNLSKYFGGNLREYKGEAPPLKLRRDIIESWPRQRKAKKHFVASMTDVFGPWVPREWQHEFLDGMYAAPLQTFQLLSKWSHVCRRVLVEWMCSRGVSAPPNVWAGFTAENQEWFDRRWQHMKLLADYGFTVFVSTEPILGPVKLPPDFLALGSRAQVIVGGESGPGARPCDIHNIRSIVEQCKSAGVACFVKQLGSKPFMGVKGFGPQITDRKGGNINEFPKDLQVREFPTPNVSA